ncbi:hypothetical protein [Pseudobacteriovorax antillogorgiicola]|uniref:D-glycero-alpha-D-manno-heptose-7-phosphate kinase n=1 Tax=Pseudobacteriovorax antillogorgiicola TaxID=1513793 RepID=A0A1Y6B4U6_9BACT|nr:hypothetical protein [Pseudobacteriovorax antillogorgiicola]TCS59315.1 D-glycero-alpha-D-manno-heptose-7-phosphate kinase [Pseudobacteriovorax antillogorgiicola]SME89470.1 D-glycero-alpha-D-manno-heptose-7-phosphate kinase [Pseudobacteriovorax antillogorgiicola]
MLTVTAEAPTRIDLAGGTLDITALSQVLDRPRTVNLGINLNAKVSIKESEDGRFYLHSLDQEKEWSGLWGDLQLAVTLPLFAHLILAAWREEWPGLVIESECQSPAGAGLGGSSCLAICLTQALHQMAYELGLGKTYSEVELVRLVQNVETKLIHCPTGCQDYWGAIRGRLNVLSFEPQGTVVETIETEDAGALADSMIVCYSGRSRASGMNNWSIFRSVFDGDRQLLDKLNQIGGLARQMADKIQGNRWQDVIELSHQEWQLRKSLWPEIETLETKAIDQAAIDAGAKFSRVCGAGGGGVMAVFVDKKKKQHVIQAIECAGGQVLEATISDSGLDVRVQR